MRRRINLSLTLLAVLMVACLFAPIGHTAGHDGDNLTSSLWAKAVLEVPGSPVTLYWKSVGADITPSGDQVISGYFYADPVDFAYGSRYNPEVFVKIYIAANGWANIAFNHVTVDPVRVHSAHHYAGSAMQTGTTTLANRLVEHQYNGVAIDTTLQSTGGSSAASSDAGYTMASDLWARALLLPDTGPVNLIWKLLGADTTPSGASVISGYFYASRDEFAYGSAYNPEVFVKIYIAANGWANIAFNHVTVDHVDISSVHQHTGRIDQARLDNRLVEHQYDYSSPVDGKRVTISGTVDDGMGNIGFRRIKYRCKFLDQNGVERQAANTDLTNKFLLSVPINMQGTVSCTPLDLPNLTLSTIASTLVSAPGDVISDENVNPASTVVAQIIESESWVDPIIRKKALLASIETEQDSDLNLMVDLATQMYANMRRRNLNVKFSGVGGGEGGGGDGGGVGGGAGDGGDASPIANASCEFIVSNDLRNGRVLHYPALADFLDDGMLNRSDLSEIAEDMQSVVGDYGPEAIQAAFNRYFNNGLGEPCSAAAGVDGEYLIKIPPNVSGFVRCLPPDHEKLVLATYVQGRQENNSLENEDVNPFTTFFSHRIASQLSGGLDKAKENYLADTAGLGDIHIVFEDDTVTGFELQPDSDPADEDAGLVAFGAASLFNILYKNNVNADYLSLLDDLVENKSVAPESLENRGVPVDRAAAWSTLVNVSNDTAGSELGSDLESALSITRITVTVTDTPGGEGITAATVEIMDLPEGIDCDNCDPGGYPHRLSTNESGIAAFTLSSVPPAPTTITFVVSGVPGYDEKMATTRVVASASVGLEIPMRSFYALTIQGGGNGEGTVTGGDIDCSIVGTAGDGTCRADIGSGQSVTLTADAADGSTFTGWSGDCSGTNPICSLTADQALTVTAIFSALEVEGPQVTITSPTSAPTHVTGNSTLSIGGTASGNVAVTQVTWSSSTGGSGVCSGTDAWSASGISLSEGDNVITVTATDAAGNTGTDTLTVTYDDIVSPTVMISTPTSGTTFSTGNPTLTIGGTAADNVAVSRVTWTNSLGGSGTCSGTTSWSVTDIALYNGTNVITITASDAVGNTGIDTLTVTYEISAPTVTINTPTSAPTHVTGNSTLNIGGTASDDIGVTSVTWANDRGGSGTCSGTTSWSASGITLYGGINEITVTVSDTVGLTSTDTLTVTYDISAPTVAITSPTSAPTHLTDSPTLNIGGIASDDIGVTSVTWSNDRGGSGTCSGTDSWSASGIALFEGDNVITVAAEDAAGNTGTDTLTVTFNDTDPPTATITSPTSGSAHTTNSATFSIGGTAGDNVGVTRVTWSNDQGGSGTCSGTTSWSAGGIALSEGDNLITVTAEDAVGNTGIDTLMVTYISVTSPPTVTIDSPTTASTYTATSATLTIGGTATDNVGVTRVTWSNSLGGGGTCSGTASWSTGSIALSLGNNLITVTAEDADGNTGTDTLTVTLPDIVSPTVTITSPTSASTYTATSSTLTIGGSASDNVGVTSVTWANNRGGNGTCSGTTSWSAGGIALYTGNNVITVTARDAAGNTGTDTLTVTLPDIPSPTVTITSPTTAPTYTATSSTLTISGTASDNVGVTQVTWTNNRGGNGTCSGTTSWSAGGIALYLGNNVITVTARDAAGNTGTDTLTVTLPDIPSPTVTIDSPTTASTYTATSATLTIGGTASDNVGVTSVTWTSSNSAGGSASGPCSGTTSWSAVGIALSLGNNVITVTARDAAGNTGTDTLTVTLPDIVSPTVTITSPTSASTYTATSSTLTIGGTASDNVGVTSVTWSNNRGGSGTCSGTTSWSASGINLVPGAVNVITIVAVDSVGNPGMDSLSVTYIPDVNPPTVTIASPTTKPTYITTTTPLNIGGTASDDIGVTSVTWSNNRGGSGTCSGTTSWSKTGITLYSGYNQITVTAWDDAGHSSTDTLTVLYDITDPTISFTSPTSASTYTTSNATLSIGGWASDNVEVRLVSWSNNRGGSGTCSGTTSWGASGITLYPGSNVITVTALDAANNTGTDVLTVTYGLPAPVQIAPPNGTVFSHYPRTTTLRWQVVPGAASYTVERQFASGGVWYSYPTVTGIKDNLYTFNFVGAQPGRWRVKAVDSSGNSGIVSVWWVFEYTI